MAVIWRSEEARMTGDRKLVERGFLKKRMATSAGHTALLPKSGAAISCAADYSVNLVARPTDI
jgi:hypothetical protein